jgi:hypothetical protein
MRNIQYAFDAVELNAVHHATDYKQVESALGYLSSWNMSFPIVTIYIAGDEEIRAVYYNKADDKRAGYVLAAVWHDDHFGFHS